MIGSWWRRHRVWAYVGAPLVFISLIFLGSVLEVGTTLGESSDALEWAYYATLAVICGLFVVLPIFQVFSKRLTNVAAIVDPNGGASQADRDALARKFLANEHVADEERSRLEYEMTFNKDTSETLRELVAAMETRMDQAILTRAKWSFAGVAVSQNGPLDGLVLFGLNCMLIRDLVRELDARPSYSELAKLYLGAFAGAFAMAQIEETNLLSLAPALGGTMGRSIAQGAGAAFVTLRVGYMAKSYLLSGGAVDKVEARRTARAAARKSLASAIASGAKNLPAEIARKAEEFCRRKAPASS